MQKLDPTNPVAQTFFRYAGIHPATQPLLEKKTSPAPPSDPDASHQFVWPKNTQGQNVLDRYWFKGRGD